MKEILVVRGRMLVVGCLSAIAGLVGCTPEPVSMLPNRSEVVIDKNASPVVRFAAEEATNFLSRTLGAEVPLVNQPTTGRVSLILGDNAWSRAAGIDVTSLPRDGFVGQATKEGRIYIAGRDDPNADPRKQLKERIRHFQYEHATLHGTYFFLEKYADVGFWFPGAIGTVVTPKASVDVPVGRQQTSPVFPQRYFAPGRMRSLWNEPGLTDTEIHNLFMLRGRFGTYRTPNCHGQRYCRYVARFAKDHPDWFCQLKDGKRHLIDTEKEPYFKNGKLCYTSPIREELYQDAKAYLTGKPAQSRGLKTWGEAGVNIPSVGNFFDMMPEDGFQRCYCENCMAQADTNALDGSYQTSIMWGMLAEMGNRLIREGVPGTLTLSSYFPYSGRPAFDLPTNILVTVSLRGPWVVNQDVFASDVESAKWWCEKTHNRVVTWSYPGKYPGMRAAPDQPQVAPRAWAKYYKAFIPYIQGGYAQCDTDRALYDMLNLQVYAHVSWDADFDVEAFLARYHRQMFGKAAAPMARVTERLEEKWINGICGKPFRMSYFGPAQEPCSASEIWLKIYSPEFVRELEGYFDQAKELVADGSREAKAVALFREQFLAPLQRRSEETDVKKELAKRAARKPVNILASGMCDDEAGWHFNGEGMKHALDTTDKAEGTASIRLETSSVEGEKPYRRAVACQDIELEVGAKYRLSYFIKTKDVVNYKYREGAGLCMLIGPNKDYAKHPLPLLVGSCPWFHQEWIFTAKEPKNRLEARICASSGTMWIDGMLLEKLEK